MEQPLVRAFLVEDEILVLLELELCLADMGFEVAGSASALDAGLAAARKLEFDVAVLDVNLGGENTGPIADALAERGIPFIFASGYTRATLPERHQQRPLLTKPYSCDRLGDALRTLLSQAAVSPPGTDH